MDTKIPGIHHVTAFADDPQRNVDFYTGVLGLRMVKRTVNFDDPGTYHFYYGDRGGTPGSILTFFPWPGAARGRQGTGQATVTAFAIPESAVGYWTERLKNAGVSHEPPMERFAETALAFADPDGLKLELVTTPEKGATEAWGEGPIPAEQAIRGFHSVALSVEGYERTAALLTGTMGFRSAQESGNRFRFVAEGGGLASVVDVLCLPDGRYGTMGAGVVHHVAWRARNDAEQLLWRQEIAALGFNVTPVMDRQYFHSIYFREPGGVLFEIATDPPGFATDETPETLGTGLKLPSWLEPRRDSIETILPPITVNGGRA